MVVVSVGERPWPMGRVQERHFLGRGWHPRKASHRGRALEEAVAVGKVAPALSCGTVFSSSCKCTPELQVYLFAERRLEHQLEDNERVADQRLFARWGVEENSRCYLAKAPHRATPRP
jgi:hypothetical protein